MGFLGYILFLGWDFQDAIFFLLIRPTHWARGEKQAALWDILENPYKNSHLQSPQLCRSFSVEEWGQG